MTTDEAVSNGLVVRTMQAAIENAGKSAAEIAAATGIGSELTWGMMIAGTTKLPISRILPFCRAVGADPAHLLRIVLEEYYAPLVELMQVIGRPLPLTANEQRLIESLRKMTENNDAQVVVADGRDVLAFVMV